MSESAALFLATGATRRQSPKKLRHFARSLKSLLAVLLLCGLVISCSDEKDTVSSVITTREGAGQIYHVDFDGSQGVLEYTHHLGATPQDLYFIFTNTNFSDTYGTTSFSSNTASDVRPMSRFSSEQNFTKQTGRTRLKDRPELLALSSELISPVEIDRKSTLSGRLPRSLLVGDSTNDFLNWNFVTNQAETIPSRLQHQIIDSSADLTLNLWVAEDVWGETGGSCLSGDKTYCMTKTMLEGFGEKFLKPDSSEDIYSWVTSLYGSPWGSHSNHAYIDESAAKTIHILYYDIDGDGSHATTGGVLGFFWSKDNAIFNESDQQNFSNISNERLIFYIDAVMAANPTDIVGQENPTGDSTWDISDEMPAELVSTLVHEFQHMIHFYQKTLLRSGRQSQTWLNEMCSMVAEDLVADKILANGPRGVAYNDYTAGIPGNGEGRLPWFNHEIYRGLVDWYAGDNVYYSYAISYAFGSYLVRNYGGAVLFNEIVQNSYSDYRAVETALASQGYQLAFADLLRRWGVAVLLSNDMSVVPNYRYNIGSGFTSSAGGMTYNLGSINLFNYHPAPAISLASSNTQTHLYKTANRFYQVGSSLTGSPYWTIEMPPGVKLTVVAKPTN